MAWQPRRSAEVEGHRDTLLSEGGNPGPAVQSREPLAPRDCVLGPHLCSWSWLQSFKPESHYEDQGIILTSFKEITPCS